MDPDCLAEFWGCCCWVEETGLIIVSDVTWLLILILYCDSSTECCRRFMLPRSNMWLLNYGFNISSKISFPFDNFEVWFHLWGAQPNASIKVHFTQFVQGQISSNFCKNCIFRFWLSSLSEINFFTGSSQPGKDCSGNPREFLPVLSMGREIQKKPKKSQWRQ